MPWSRALLNDVRSLGSTSRGDWAPVDAGLVAVSFIQKLSFAPCWVKLWSHSRRPPAPRGADPLSVAGCEAARRATPGEGRRERDVRGPSSTSVVRAARRLCGLAG